MFPNHRVSKLLESLSLGSGSSKLTKLFHHSSSSSSSTSASPSKKLNPAMQYLLQAGPQGLLRIWPTALSEEMNYCSFMVNMTTTSAEIIKLVFEKYEVVDDPRRFYVCQASLGKGGELCSVCRGKLCCCGGMVVKCLAYWTFYCRWSGLVSAIMLFP